MYMQRLIGKVLDEEELLEQIEKEEELALINKGVNNSSGYILGAIGGSKNPNRYDIIFLSFHVNKSVIESTYAGLVVALHA